MNEISKIIIPGNTVPYDLRDDYARERINNSHLFIVSPLTTSIINIYTLLGRVVEPYEGLMLHILCTNNNNDSITPTSIRLAANELPIEIEYSNFIRRRPINGGIYSFVLHYIPEEETTPAHWNFYPIDDTLKSKGVEIIEYTTEADAAHAQVKKALSQNILPVVHYIDTNADNYEYWLPLYEYATDKTSFIFSASTAYTSSEDISLSYIRINLDSTTWAIDNCGTNTVNIPTMAQAKGLFYGTCQTSNATAAKTVTGVADWPEAFFAGQTILIKFQHGNNVKENLTLSINGSTPAPIVAYDGVSPATIWAAGSILLFIYSGTDWRLVDGHNNVKILGDLGMGYGSCANALEATAKNASIQDYVLTTGSLVAIRFTYSVPAGSTLNISGTGAKAIYYKGAPIQSNIIKNNDTALFVYTGSVYELLTTTSKNLLPLTTSTDYIVCTTSANNSIKIATLSGFTLPTAANPSGHRFAVNFKNSVPANAQLNISSTGARHIICNNANISANTIQANDVVILESSWNASLATAQYIVRAIDRNNIRHVYENSIRIRNTTINNANGHIYESPTDIKGYWSATTSTGSTTATNPTICLYNNTNGFTNIAPDMVHQIIGSAYIEIGSRKHITPIILDQIDVSRTAFLQAHLANFSAPANSTPTYYLQIICPKK